MDPNPGSFPILSYVMSRLPSLGPRPSAAVEFDIEQPHPPPLPHTSSSGQPEIVGQMPHLTDPKLLAAMTLAISDVAQTRSVLKLIGERPDHEAVDNAKAKLADIEALLSKQLEEIVLSPRPENIDILQWRAHQAEREKECRELAEKEKRAYKSMIQLDEMHGAYEKLLKDAEKRLVEIYESAGEGAEYAEEEKPVREEVNEEVVGILQEAYGKGMERVELSGRRLRLLPEAFGRIPGLVVLDLSNNQLEVCLLGI